MPHSFIVPLRAIEVLCDHWLEAVELTMKLANGARQKPLKIVYSNEGHQFIWGDLCDCENCRQDTKPVDESVWEAANAIAAQLIPLIPVAPAEDFMVRAGVILGIPDESESIELQAFALGGRLRVRVSVIVEDDDGVSCKDHDKPAKDCAGCKTVHDQSATLPPTEWCSRDAGSLPELLDELRAVASTWKRDVYRLRSFRAQRATPTFPQRGPRGVA